MPYHSLKLLLKNKSIYLLGLFKDLVNDTYTPFVYHKRVFFPKSLITSTSRKICLYFTCSLLAIAFIRLLISILITFRYFCIKSASHFYFLFYFSDGFYMQFSSFLIPSILRFLLLILLSALHFPFTAYYSPSISFFVRLSSQARTQFNLLLHSLGQ